MIEFTGQGYPVGNLIATDARMVFDNWICPI